MLNWGKFLEKILFLNFDAMRLNGLESINFLLSSEVWGTALIVIQIFAIHELTLVQGRLKTRVMGLWKTNTPKILATKLLLLRNIAISRWAVSPNLKSYD